MRNNKNVKRRKKPQKRVVKLSFWSILGIAALLCLFIAWPYLRGGRLATYGTAVPEGYDYFCLDLSHYNSSVEWDSLRVAIDARGYTTRSLLHASRILPLRWAVMKATEGEEMSDDRFQDYWSEAGRINISRGAYHFFRSSKDPKKQAQNYIRIVKKLRIDDLPPILDVETIHKGCSRKLLCDKVLTWLEIVEKHYGKKPIVYTSDSFARTYLSSDITDNYPLWIARYNEEPPRSNWSIWQFTDKALVIGVEGYVDLSVIRSIP